jgi:hypothetical protein
MKPINKEIIDYLNYEPDTGEFIWIKDPGKSLKAGKSAGYVITSGRTNSQRLVIHFKGKRYSASKLAFLLMTGKYPKGHVRFRDKNTLNYAWDNLTLDLDDEKVTAPKMNWKSKEDIKIPPIALAHKLNKIF